MTAAIQVAILTISDRSAQGVRDDASGPVIRDALTSSSPPNSAPRFQIVAEDIVPDEPEMISAKLIDYCDILKADLVLTTGGTGFGPRDFTPEATLKVIEREVPGIPEAMRAEGLKKTPKAMLSRQRAGLRGKTLIVNLPGHPKAVREGLDVVLETIGHILKVMHGVEAHR